MYCIWYNPSARIARITSDRVADRNIVVGLSDGLCSNLVRNIPVTIGSPFKIGMGAFND
jgi:hypothetical protein